MLDEELAPSAEAVMTVEGTPSTAKPAHVTPRSKARKRSLAIIGLVVAAAAIVWTSYYALVASNAVSTDDAYVGANVALITPLVSGAVVDVDVQDAQAVRRGDVLVELDPTDAQLAVEQAQAEYGRAVRRVRQFVANTDTATSEIAARDADLARARAQIVSAQGDLVRSRIDLQRRQSLVAFGDVSGEELSTARNAAQSAEAALKAAQAGVAKARADRAVAQGQQASATALTSGADLDSNPEVAAARAALSLAEVNLSRTTVRAPVDGLVTRRRVQTGQRVAVGAELMMIVPIAQVYVDANFKEVQLRKVERGQPVTLTADRYGGGVVFHGRVAGIGGGTGSAFAILPAQNATGNWIKVVQRLPVRITLDPREVARHPLRVGLSMNAKIDVHGPPASSAAGDFQ